MKAILGVLVFLLFVQTKFVSVESTNGSIDIVSSAGATTSIAPCEEICDREDLMDMVGMDVNDTMEEDSYNMDNETDTEMMRNDSSIDMYSCVCATPTVNFGMTSEISATIASPTMTDNGAVTPTGVFVSPSMTATDVTSAVPTSISGTPTTTSIAFTTTTSTIATSTSTIATSTTSVATTIATSTTAITTSTSASTIMSSTSQPTTVTSSTVNAPTTPVTVDTGEAGGGGNVAGIAAGLSLGLGLPIIILTIIAIIICYKLYIAKPGRYECWFTNTPPPSVDMWVDGRPGKRYCSQ